MKEVEFVRYRRDIENAIPTEIDEKVRHATLYVAAVKGDWGKVEEIYKNYPEDVLAILGFSRSEKKFKSITRDSDSDFGDTALIVATAAGRNEFVKKLASEYLKDKDLEMKNHDGNTAFCLAAMRGNMGLVLLMLEKNK